MVKTPYGEAKFYKNSDGTRSKVKLRKKRPTSPIGIESKPVMFNDKENLKDLEGREDDEARTLKAGDAFLNMGDHTQGEGEDVEGESQEHTVSTIVESDRINFGG